MKTNTEYQWIEKSTNLSNSLLGNEFIQGVKFFKKLIPKKKGTRPCFADVIWYRDSLITTNGHYLIKYQVGLDTDKPVSLPGEGLKEAEKAFDLLKPIYIDRGDGHFFIGQAGKLVSLGIGEPKIPVSAIDRILDSDLSEYRISFDHAECIPILKNSVRELKTTRPRDFFCKIDTEGKLGFEVNGETITKRLNVSKTMSYGYISVNLLYLSQLIGLFKHGQVSLNFSGADKPLLVRCSSYPVEIYLMPMIRR